MNILSISTGIWCFTFSINGTSYSIVVDHVFKIILRHSTPIALRKMRNIFSSINERRCTCIFSHAWKTIRKLNSVRFEHSCLIQKWQNPLIFDREKLPYHQIPLCTTFSNSIHLFRVLNSLFVMLFPCCDFFFVAQNIEVASGKGKTKSHKSAYIFSSHPREMTAYNHEWKRNFLRWLN